MHNIITPLIEVAPGISVVCSMKDRNMDLLSISVLIYMLVEIALLPYHAETVAENMSDSEADTTPT